MIFEVRTNEDEVMGVFEEFHEAALLATRFGYRVCVVSSDVQEENQLDLPLPQTLTE